MVKTYILAPNWSIAPPPEGPIHLGDILDSLTEFVPVNRTDKLPIPPPYLNPIDIKSGFTTSRSHLLSGELGLFAKVIGLAGIGGAADIYYKKDQNDILSCKTLETITFDASPAYITESMALSDVQKFMQGAKFRVPVYMITGLKIGKGASLQSNNSKEKGLKMDGGLSSSMIPVEVGLRAGLELKKMEGESWNHSTDFIVAFRVKKIWYKRGDVKNKSYNKNVVMQGSMQKEVGMTLLTDDDIGLKDFCTDESLRIDTDIENGEAINWIIPNIGLESSEVLKRRDI